MEGVRAVERATGRLTFPFLIVTLAGTVLTGCWMHGYSTVYLIFGPEDADRLLGVNTGAGINSNWGLGLPFIPMTLVAARTSYTDNLLPILPIFYFASTAPQRDGSLWPPSAAMAVATLPYIRAAYNEFWKRVCTPMVKAWIKQVQPRAGENEEGENPEQGHNQGPANELGDGVNIELDFQVDIMGEGEEEEEEEEEDLAGVLGQGRANQDQNQNPNQNPNQQQPGNQDQNQQQNRNPHQHQHVNPGGMPGEANRIVLDTIAIPQTIIGALIFPTISAAMGALLKITLPKTWTTPPTRWDRYPAGFLQSRFGRSIVGGCLFVVLKDTLMLYSRYRLAQDHKQRRVVNFNGKRGKKS